MTDNKFVRRNVLFGYFCILFSFPLLVDGFQNLITTIVFGWDNMILYFLLKLFIGPFLFIIGYRFLIFSRELEKYNQPVQKQVILGEEKFYSQLKNYKVWLLFLIGFFVINFSYIIIGIGFYSIYIIIASIILAFIFIRIMKTIG